MADSPEAAKAAEQIVQLGAGHAREAGLQGGQAGSRTQLAQDLDHFVTVQAGGAQSRSAQGLDLEGLHTEVVVPLTQGAPRELQELGGLLAGPNPATRAD